MNAVEGPVRVYLQVAAEAETQTPEEGPFSHWVNRALQASGTHLPAHACVTIRVVGRDESRALNREFRGADKPTNVLAFPAGPVLVPEPLEEVEVGDLVLCAPVVAAEADEQGKTLEAHFAHLAVHGALHLAGFDHIVPAEAARMESIETEVMLGLGYPDPYMGENRAEE